MIELQTANIFEIIVNIRRQFFKLSVALFLRVSFALFVSSRLERRSSYNRQSAKNAKDREWWFHLDLRLSPFIRCSATFRTGTSDQRRLAWSLKVQVVEGWLTPAYNSFNWPILSSKTLAKPSISSGE